MLPWLTSHGLEEHEDTIGNYVSESTELADLRGMLTSEQEDEEEEDLKDLIKDMELSADEATRFREAIAAIVLPLSPKEQAEAKKVEEEKDIKTDRIWKALEAELELETAGSGDLEQARATIAQKDELLAAKDEAHARKLAQKDALLAKKDEAHAETRAELERLRAQLGSLAEGVPP